MYASHVLSDNVRDTCAFDAAVCDSAVRTVSALIVEVCFSDLQYNCAPAALQCVAVCCSVQHCIAVSCNVLQCVAV